MVLKYFAPFENKIHQIYETSHRCVFPRKNEAQVVVGAFSFIEYQLRRSHLASKLDAY